MVRGGPTRQCVKRCAAPEIVRNFGNDCPYASAKSQVEYCYTTASCRSSRGLLRTMPQRQKQVFAVRRWSFAAEYAPPGKHSRRKQPNRNERVPPASVWKDDRSSQWAWILAKRCFRCITSIRSQIVKWRSSQLKPASSLDCDHLDLRAKWRGQVGTPDDSGLRRAIARVPTETRVFNVHYLRSSEATPIKQKNL